MTQTNDDDRIRGKVAAILSERELVLNIGPANGVYVGMKFAILNSQGIDIKDPETGEILGSVEVPKTVVKVVRIGGDRLSIARTFRTIKGTPGVLSTMSSISGTPDRIETLKIASGSDLRAELPAEQSRIKIGDIAVSSRGDEYDDM